jgi:hypothetical protein
MPCPSFATTLVGPFLIQAAAGIGFQIIHDPFGPILRFHYQVDVVRAHMGRKQLPLLLLATIQQSVQYDSAVTRTEPIGWLIHVSQFRLYQLTVSFQQAASRQIVMAIDGARRVPVQVAAVAGKGDEIDHDEGFDTT